MKKILLCLLCLGLAFSAKAQWLEHESVMPDSVSAWNVPSPSSYAGSYAFGDSEWESTLRVFVSGDKVWAQLQQGKWVEKDGNLTWELNYENFEDVRIAGSRFYSSKTNGKFVQFKVNAVMQMGLLIEDSWSDDIEDGAYEIGPGSRVVFVNGNYPEASLRALNREELEAKPKEPLSMMRNEIFARYGYTFKKGGAMESYFSKQNWYTPIHTDVNSFLTEVELANIKLIREIEANK